MELYDIIISSVLLFGLAIGFVVLISYVLFKIRNQVKTIRSKKINYSKTDEENMDGKEEKLNLNKAKDKDYKFEKGTIKNIARYHKEKFEVLNKAPEAESSLNSGSKHDPTTTKNYEKTDLKKMFKLKPDDSEE